MWQHPHSMRDFHLISVFRKLKQEVLKNIRFKDWILCLLPFSHKREIKCIRPKLSLHCQGQVGVFITGELKAQVYLAPRTFKVQLTPKNVFR